MKVRCIREGNPAKDAPEGTVPVLGQIYTVIDVINHLSFEECPIWYVLEETGIMLQSYKLFETVKENSIKITKVNAINILKLRGLKNEMGKF